jgi:tetratricopeptide (TPR) repeat protein
MPATGRLRVIGSAAGMLAPLLLLGCQTRAPRAQAPDAPAPAIHASSSPMLEGKEDRPRPPSAPCPVEDRQDVDAALDEAAHRFEKTDYLVALACAEQASRAAPRSVEAHHDRADALAALERFDEAKQAYTMALALDPEDPQTLASAADFYVNRLGSDHDLALIGLEYARRGSAHVGRRRDDRELAAHLALLEAEALDDLGRADEALPRAEAALRLDAASAEARYQRALILFHLCKLDRARGAFEDVLRRSPADAFAHHHLGLILEREGRIAEAEAHLLKARALAPTQFQPPVLPSKEEFRAMVDAAVDRLDPATRSLLGTVEIETADLPELADLTAVDPPFPPTILGLYRGGGGGAPKSIVLYRKNLARSVATRADLEKQVRITLLHELGHLTGADEDELRARGFE